MGDAIGGEDQAGSLQGKVIVLEDQAEGLKVTVTKTKQAFCKNTVVVVETKQLVWVVVVVETNQLVWKMRLVVFNIRHISGGMR